MFHKCKPHQGLRSFIGHFILLNISRVVYVKLIISIHYVANPCTSGYVVLSGTVYKNKVACNYGDVDESEVTASLKTYVGETIDTKEVIRKSKHKIEKVEFKKLLNNHLCASVIIVYNMTDVKCFIENDTLEEVHVDMFK
ncbi:hypothetical protein P879_00720 [Paragonimus westermani]|uniref:Uncharacterized protein n=1 Tax=Paragonimus westermani TaxID=34504 RepID=A0A8T0DHA5_9TREM|nr:hypothetical protein P879_00720 [Paragonimus westermani]